MSRRQTEKRIGLVLTGGGARAAYQAGVLKGIQEILGETVDNSPFDIFVGASAGAINSTFLAAQNGHFSTGVEALCQVWGELRSEQVIRADFLSLSALSMRWLRDLSLGGLLGSSRSNHLIDARPLGEFLAKHINFKAIKRNIRSGDVYGVAVSATNYLTGATVVFFDGSPAIEPWVRLSRVAQRTSLTLRHLLASAAIPIFFEPVRLHNNYYGDGCVRLTSPLSPAIRMGAERILAIGVRHLRPENKTLMSQQGSMPDISLADVAGVMLNAAFLDALDLDAERMQRINETAASLAEEGRIHPSQLRDIPLLVIRPSQDLGTLASEEFNRFSPMLRYLLKGIGASAQKGWDLLSYLAFDSAYTRHLMELGQADALARRDDIVTFFKD